MPAGLTMRCLTFREMLVCTRHPYVWCSPTQASQLTLAFKRGVATLDGGSTAQDEIVPPPGSAEGHPTSNIAVLTFFHSNRYALAEAGLFEGNVLAIADLDREHVLTRRQLHIDDRRAIAEVNPRVSLLESPRLQEGTRC